MKIALLFFSLFLLPLHGNEVVEREKMETPKYLYKILSLKNWYATQSRKVVILSAEDNAFIHLATEEQLEGVIGKFWSDVPEYAVLKLETKQLEGELVLESGYYHLYNGCIPFTAIVDAKENGACSVEPLPIVQVGDPVLRKMTRKLSVEEILSPEIQNLIEEMKVTMRKAPGVGLAAPQIGRDIQLAVIEDDDLSQLTEEQMAEKERYPVPFHVIINPVLIIEEADTAEHFEGCLSVPALMGVVPRAKAVRVECLNEKGEPIVIHARGWHARILQHEVDHLNAELYIDKAFSPTLITIESYIKLWKDKSVEEVKEALGGD